MIYPLLSLIIPGTALLARCRRCCGRVRMVAQSTAVNRSKRAHAIADPTQSEPMPHRMAHAEPSPMALNHQRNVRGVSAKICERNRPRRALHRRFLCAVV